jgi:hypothetical protein
MNEDMSIIYFDGPKVAMSIKFWPAQKAYRFGHYLWERLGETDMSVKKRAWT